MFKEGHILNTIKLTMQEFNYGSNFFIMVPNNFVFPQAICQLCYVNKTPLFKSTLITRDADANSIP